MPSTFTTNTGIEKPGQGEQSGSWGITVNTNMDIVDRALNGSVNITLTGSTSTITTNDGSLSNGHFKVVNFNGTLAAPHTITIAPADAQKIYFVKNNTNRTLTFTQGTGQVTATVVSNAFGIVYADGSDECFNLSSTVSISTLQINGEPVTSSATELNVLDGISATLTASELSILDGVTADKDEINTLDGVAATLTAEELNVLDGFTGDTDDLNFLKALNDTGTTSTQFGHLGTVTENVQSALDTLTTNVTGLTNDKLNKSGGTVTGQVKFNDNVHLDFGTGNDAEVYHNGSNLIFDMNADDDILFRDGNSSNATRFTFDTSSGNFTATGNVTAFSDAALKTDITTIDNALDKVAAMRGVFFNKDGERGVGVVAQEVQKVVPEAVFDGGEYLSVAYGNLVGVLVEAVKDLKSQVEELKNASSD